MKLHCEWLFFRRSYRTFLTRYCLALAALGLRSTFHVTEVAPILARGNLKCALKNVAHGIHIPETTLACDRLHTVLTFLQTATSGFDAKTLDELRGRGFQFLGEDARAISGTHRYPLRQPRHSQRPVAVTEHPG